MIHPQARIDSTVKIGSGTSVWQFATVIRGAVLGVDCSVGACSVIDAAAVGDRCRIGHGAQLHPGLMAGDEIFFGPGCIVCNDPWPRVRKGDFDIGRITNGDFVTVRIGHGASLGAGSIVMPGVSIGEGAMVAAGAVVTQSLESFHMLKRCGEVVVIDRRQVSRMRAAP